MRAIAGGATLAGSIADPDTDGRIDMRLIMLGTVATLALTLGSSGALALALQTGPTDCVPTGGPDLFRGDELDNACDLRGGRDRLQGKKGDDALSGGSGSDLVIGGRDDDRLRGGDGKDKLRGGDGDDTVADNGGTSDRDRLRGDEGDDVVSAFDGDGKDRFDGGPGVDTCIGDGGDAFIDCEQVSVSTP
jgi:Ca2+-binding RTX toxin-like protein